MTFDDFLLNFSSSLTSASLWSLGIAFAGGILSSSVCPCTLPMGLGVAGMVSSGEAKSKKQGLFLSFAFFFGIVINLLLLGFISTRIGEFLTESFGKYWSLGMSLIALIAGIVAIVGPRFKVAQLQALRRPGVLGSFSYGFIFSLGTSAAPLLLLLTIAAAQKDLMYSMLLAFVFGLGRGLPFLLVGFFAGLTMRLARINIARKAIQITSGVVLLIVSGYFYRMYLLFS
jgi:cytochrome c-type biogenesis protein